MPENYAGIWRETQFQYRLKKVRKSESTEYQHREVEKKETCRANVKNDPSGVLSSIAVAPLSCNTACLSLRRAVFQYVLVLPFVPSLASAASPPSPAW